MAGEMPIQETNKHTHTKKKTYIPDGSTTTIGPSPTGLLVGDFSTVRTSYLRSRQVHPHTSRIADRYGSSPAMGQTGQQVLAVALHNGVHSGQVVAVALLLAVRYGLLHGIVQLDVGIPQAACRVGVVARPRPIHRMVHLVAWVSCGRVVRKDLDLIVVPLYVLLFRESVDSAHLVLWKSNEIVRTSYTLNCIVHVWVQFTSSVLQLSYGFGNFKLFSMCPQNSA